MTVRDRARADRYRREKQGRPEWIRLNAERSRWANYGITPEQYDALALRAQGRCELCGRQDDNANGGRSGLGLDHCHGTMRPRGLLCIGCNTALGQIERISGGGDMDKWFREAMAWISPGPPTLAAGLTEPSFTEPGTTRRSADVRAMAGSCGASWRAGRARVADRPLRNP